MDAPALETDGNPKDRIGSDKLPLHQWPATATAMGCIALFNGALKYGRTNWRATGVRATVYLDALERHAHALREGEWEDEEGVPHLSSMLACCAIITDAHAAGTLIDDRNYRGEGYRKLVTALTPHVPRLRRLHADRSPRQYTIADQLECAPTEPGP